ncbi:hypothetical protein Tco_0485539 [Tanacetum coccineum]
MMSCALNPAPHSYPQCIPPESLVKITAFSDSKFAYGIVVQDCVNTLIRVYGKSCFATSPFMLKLPTYRYSLCMLLAYNQGWCGAIVELDSQTSISLSSSEAVPHWSLGDLSDDIHTWSNNLQLKFSWDVSFPYELTSLASNDLYGRSFVYK